MKEPIILIGPLKTGKTTIGQMLASRLHLTFTSLDTLEREYARHAGFDEKRAEQIQLMQGDFAWYSYRRQFFDSVVLHFLLNHQQGILELGGGHPILPTMEQQARVESTLALISNVVLLIPTSDLNESCQILKRRQKPERLHPDLNDIFLADDRFFKMAKHIVYTFDKSPEQVVDDILQQLA